MLFPPSPLPPLACCVEGPSAYRPKAQHAVRMLLVGLGLEPRWTDRDGLSGEGLYYGPEPDAVPAASVALRLDPATAAYFGTRTPLDPARIGTLRWDGDAWPLPFAGDDPVAGADVIASTFFWLAGWPEWTTTARDAHGRYPYAGSLHETLDLAQRPVVDVYRLWLGERLAEAGVGVPGRQWAGRSWAVAPTVDVDFVRTRRLGAFVRGLRGSDPRALARAVRPGDARWHALQALGHLLAGQGGTVFLKAAAPAPEDVGYRLTTRRMRRWVAGLTGRGVEIGLHPSYAAFDHPARLRAEQDRLAAVCGRAPVGVRSHYLRWSEPTTPRLYAASGLGLDSTLGFARQPGFRRGTSVPFQLFDLDANAPLALWEMPLLVMDTALFTHLGLPREAARAVATGVLEAVRRVGGCAVLLWHNDPGGGGSEDGQALLRELLRYSETGAAAVGGLRGLLASWAGRGD